MEGYLVDGAENPADRTSWEKGNLKSHEFYKVNCTIPKWWLALKVEISQPSNSIKVYWPRFGATIWRGFAWTRPKLDSISLGVKIQKMFLKSPTTNYQEYQVGCMFFLSKSHCVYRVSGFHFAEFCLHWFRTFSNYSKKGRPRVVSSNHQLAATLHDTFRQTKASREKKNGWNFPFRTRDPTAFHGKGETF